MKLFEIAILKWPCILVAATIKQSLGLSWYIASIHYLDNLRVFMNERDSKLPHCSIANSYDIIGYLSVRLVDNNLYTVTVDIHYQYIQWCVI